jgi:hypothetical protein
MKQTKTGDKDSDRAEFKRFTKTRRIGLSAQRFQEIFCEKPAVDGQMRDH